MLNRETFVASTTGHATHTNTAENELRPVRRFFEPGDNADLKIGAYPAHDFAANPGYCVGAREIYVEKRQFGDIKEILSLRKSVDKERRPYATAADDGYLTHMC
jgi:hypothetical protein